MRMLLAGNWKMNGLKASLAEIRSLKRGLADEGTRGDGARDVLICPPATLIADAVKAADGSPLAVGGQDCHGSASGAFTGDISAERLRDVGATAVIVGHSERRQYHGETNVIVAAKVKAAHRAGLMAILCVGESDKLRESGRAVPSVLEQLKASIPPELDGASGGRGSLRSSALAKLRASAMPGRPLTSCAASSTARFRTAPRLPIWSSPMSRSGRSARDSPPPPGMSSRFMALSGNS